MTVNANENTTWGNEILMYLHLYFHFFAVISRQSVTLSSATQHAMSPELGENWRRSVLTIQ